MDIKTVFWVNCIFILLILFVPMVYFAKQETNQYKKRCNAYFESFADICNTSVGRLHISQIDEHKAPEIYLEIYKDSYQRILNCSVAGSCIVLDTVVDSQDKQTL